MKKSQRIWIVVGTIGIMFLFGALCNIRILYDGNGHLLAWRVFLPWSGESMKPDQGYKWVCAKADAAAPGETVTVFEARLYGLLGRFWVLIPSDEER